MCTSVKLWGNKTLNADYQNTKEFWENKSILREQFNFENKSWERLLEDLQSNFLRMLVKNITYMKLLDILNLSRTWKVGTLFRKFPAQRQPHHQQFTSTYQFNQGSHRGEILILPRPLCLQIHMSQLSELNFSSIGFRREVDENSKFKWIWGELVLFSYLRRTGTGRADVWWNISKSSQKLFHEKAAEVLQLKGNTLNEVLVQNRFMIMARKLLKKISNLKKKDHRGLTSSPPLCFL